MRPVWKEEKEEYNKSIAYHDHESVSESSNSSETESVGSDELDDILENAAKMQTKAILH